MDITGHSQRVGTPPSRYLHAVGPQAVTPIPRPVDIGPTTSLLMSGDRWLDTPGWKTGIWYGGTQGVPPDPPTLWGLGSCIPARERDYMGNDLGVHRRADWPALGGMFAGLEWVGYGGEDIGAINTGALVGWHEFPLHMPRGVGFGVQANLLDDGPELYCTFTTIHDGEVPWGDELWGTGEWNEDPDNAEYWIRRSVGPINAQDTVAAAPLAGDHPRALIIWTELQQLRAAVAEVTVDAPHPEMDNTVPPLITTLTAPTLLGVPAVVGFSGAEMVALPTDAGAVMAWRATDGIRVAVLTVTGTTVSVARTGLVHAGSFVLPDLAWLGGTEFVVAGQSTGGGVHCVYDTASGATRDVATETGPGYRAAAVSGHPVTLTHQATGWRINVYADAGVQTFSAGPNGPVVPGAWAAGSPGTDRSAIAGHPDGRLYVMVDRNITRQLGNLTFNEMHEWGPTMLFTYDTGALTLRDQVLTPIDQVAASAFTSFVRLNVMSDYFIGATVYGMDSGVTNECPFFQINWMGMAPNMWFYYIVPMGENRYAIVNTTTNYETWGPWFYDPTLNPFTLQPRGFDLANGSRQSICVFELDDEGAVSAAGHWAPINRIGTANLTAVGDNNRAYVTAVGTDLYGGDYIEEVIAYDIDDDLNLTQTARTEITGFSTSAGGGVQPAGGSAILIGDCLVWAEIDGWRAARVGQGGTVTAEGALHPWPGTFRTLAPGFNNTGTTAIRRIGNTNLIAITGVSGPTSSSRSQYAVLVSRFDPATLTFTVVDRTTPYDPAAPAVPADFLGWVFPGGEGASMMQFSADGQHVVFILGYHPQYPPWSQVPVGSQPFALTTTRENILAWVDITTGGEITVSYYTIDFPWKGQLVTSAGQRPPSHVTAGLVGTSYLFAQPAFPTGELDQWNLTGVTGPDDCVVIGYPHEDVSPNPFAYITTFQSNVLWKFRRDGDVATLVAMEGHRMWSTSWHWGLIPLEHAGGFLEFWDGEPHGSSRNSSWEFDTDSYGAQVRVIGAPTERGDASIIRTSQRVTR